MDARTIVVLEGDDTGQELLDEALRLLRTYYADHLKGESDAA